MVNTTKSESKNKNYREAGQAGNGREVEFHIMKNQWGHWLLQHMVDGGFFLTRNGKPIQTGKQVTQLATTVLYKPNSRLLVPPPPAFIKPNWYIRNKRPQVCIGGLKVKQMDLGKTGSHTQKKYKSFLTNQYQSSNFKATSSDYGDISDDPSYLKANKLVLPEGNKVIVGDAITISTDLEISFKTIIQVTDIDCVVPKNVELNVNSYTPTDAVDGVDEELIKIRADLCKILDEIVRLQKQATQLDQQIQKKKQTKRNDKTGQMKNWTPFVFVKGNILIIHRDETTSSKNAGKTVEITQHTVIVPATHICRIFKTKELPEGRVGTSGNKLLHLCKYF
jgi:hypothetical protein